MGLVWIVENIMEPGGVQATLEVSRLLINRESRKTRLTGGVW